MQNIVWKLALVLAVVAMCLLAIRFKEFRPGTDLRGGVSLVYKVSIPENATDAQGIVTQTISVLKERVNPKGVFDITMAPLGRDRIEIVMPLPNEEVQALAAQFRADLAVLLAKSEILEGDLDDALRRGAAPGEIGGEPGSERADLTARLQSAYDEVQRSRRALDDVQAAGATDEEVRRSQLAVAQAELAYEDLRREVLSLSLSDSRVRRVLALPTSVQPLKNPDGTTRVGEDGLPVMGPSQRDVALDRIRAEYGHVATELDAVVAAFDVYQAERTGFDDPEDLIRLLRGAGVLEFRIAVSAGEPENVDIDEMRRLLQELGPDNAISTNTRWFPINELKQWYENPEQLAALEKDPVAFFQRLDLVAERYEGEHYLLLYTTIAKALTHEEGRPPWAIIQTALGVDSFGRQAVNFTLDGPGGIQMNRLTGAHINQPMAIVLDGEVYSAPNINSTIAKNGQIVGNFSADELNYLIRVLAAGSLQARLSSDPIAINTVGPSIGEDNLQSGKIAFIISLIAVAVFMVAYYFFAGIVAVVALLLNGIIIFGLMMGIDATFTLPGMAGIVLTIGMAVDANVLIYERIREELAGGFGGGESFAKSGVIFGGDVDLRTAVRQGYRKALSTIIDANVTNLIVCFVLFQTATTEVKGFALTLTIGICATLFTALFVTRQIYYLYTDLLRIRSLPMLPIAVPAIHKALEPSINWIGLRRVFWTLSIVAVAGSVFLVSARGVDMFDTEFRGGVALTMLTAPLDEDGDGAPDRLEDGSIARRTLRHSGDPDAVEDRIRQLGIDASAATGANETEATRLRILAELENALVLTAGDTEATPDGTFASAFQVKVSSPKGLDDDATITRVVVDAIVEELGGQLDVTPPLTYAGADDTDASVYVFEIKKDELGQNINRPEATQRVREFLGGAAVLLKDVDPPVTVDDIDKRIERMRNQPDFARYSGRRVKVFGLEPANPDGRGKEYVDFAVCVYDPYRSSLNVDMATVWYPEVADAEWRLIGAALQKPTSLEQVSSYSSAVAETLSAQAIVAVILTLLGILVYIWVRFGSLRYSVAAIVALVHDVTIALGLLALSGLIGKTVIGSALLIEPFRIDLGVVAALLTIIGYSLNDTIVILDRIRENRGKLPLPTADIVNRSINQTVSRTLLTSVTTLLAVGIMYFQGGTGIRPFTFCLLVGLVVGTYSSVAIAAPLVFTGWGTTGPQKAATAGSRAAEEPVVA